MSHKFTLFDNFPFLNPISAEEVLWVEKLLKNFSGYKDHIPSLALPSKITDHMIYCFLKALHDGHLQIHPNAWHQFLDTLFTKGLLDQLHCLTLKNYLLIELAQKQNLSRYLDEDQRITLAYMALHGSHETRKVLLKHAKHFEVTDSKVLEDLAFKGILLGGALDFDLNQFMPQRLEVIKQFILHIGKIDQAKAFEELEKMEFHFPSESKSLKDHLEAS